jgi:hypothetical protein
MKYESLFDGTLGTWKGEDYNIELRSDATPYHARAFPIPRIHEQTLQHEVDQLCKIGVLKKVNRSEWAAPTFIIPKKDGTVPFISDFRELNKAKTISYTQNTRSIIETRRFSVCDFTRSQYGILPH